MLNKRVDIYAVMQKLKPLEIKILMLLMNNRELTIDGIVYFLSSERIYVNKAMVRRRLLRLKRFGLIEKKWKMVKEFEVNKVACFYKLSKKLRRKIKMLERIIKEYKNIGREIPYAF